MARSDELENVLQFAGKFGPAGAPEEKDALGFHQGVIESWDAQTLRNSVRLLGTVVHDLPFLATSDTVTLLEGDTVAVLRFRSSYFLLGRVIPPGADLRNQGAFESDFVSGFAPPASYTDLVSFAIPVPYWATYVNLTAVASGAVKNTTDSSLNWFGGIFAMGRGLAFPNSIQSFWYQGLDSARTLAGPVTPGGSVTVRYTANVGLNSGSVPAHPDNHLNLEATAFFSSN